EQIQIYNVDNGERFTTYAIRGEEGSKIISVNGAAAHKAGVGHRVIICAYAHYSEAELASFKPHVLYMGADGDLSHTSNAIPVQVA
ncbi:MAG TPA: aspartate 1-decarboxylase, partial [Pseudomonas sp.]|nr:aspartate 1-decarboxylase [Pseudomonas sp.]